MNLVNLASTGAATSESHEETKRIMQICNACRYCEGFCAVFPAMERRREFGVGDTAYLANLCHNCGACYHSCQYAPPHEFAVNAPETLAERRVDSYAEFAWPRPMGKLFERNGLVVSMVLVAVLSLAVGLMLAMINPTLFWGVHLGEGAFYQIMPHTVMAGIPLGITAFVVVSFIMGWRNYWRATGISIPSTAKNKFGLMIAAIGDAMAASASLRYLGGDNAGDGPGCPQGYAGGDDRSSNARKYYHHLTFYGFMMCFASTSLGTIYHYVFHREAPYGYFELPVVLGTVGGIILCIGTAGLWVEKRRMAAAMISWRRLGMDYAFIGLLFSVSLTGLILLVLRDTSLMGLTLAIHLGFVYAFFLVLPFSKFVHGLYRFAALIQSAIETKHS